MLAFFIVLGVIILLFMGVLTARLVWNVRLRRFQKKNGIPQSNRLKMALGANIAGLNLLLVVGILTVVGGAGFLNSPKIKSIVIDKHIENEVEYTNAKKFESAEEFEQIWADIQNNANYNYRDGWFFNGGAKDGAVDLSQPSESTSSGSDTYEQIKGVSEADIAKLSKDHRYLFYAPKYRNLVYKISLDGEGNHTEYTDILFKDVTITEMLLHENYLIVFGSSYQPYPIDGPKPEEEVEIDMNWYISKSVYIVIDIEAFVVKYRGEVDGYLQETRLTDKGILYLLSNRYIQFRDGKPIDLPSFENTYYFGGEVTSSGLTKLTAINLNDGSVHDLGFMGNNQAFFMGNNFILLSNSKWSLEGRYTSQIIAVKYDGVTGAMTYAGSASVVGSVLNQYFFDDYKGQIRVVTTHGPKDLNSLYIFNTNPFSDQLTLIGHLNKGIGKEGESVKSVSFREDIVQIVTFRQTDPLYTIDLKDPTNPKILPNEVLEPGFSTGIVIWDDEGNSIGIGYMADENGRLLGIKVSAYRVGVTKPVQTIEFPWTDEESPYANAVYNQREHLLVSREKGLYGFIVGGLKSQIAPITDSRGYYTRVSRVMLFNVDFSEEIVLKPFEALAKADLDNSIEKIVYVGSYIHILSIYEDLVFNISTEEFGEALKFPTNRITD